MGTAEDFVEAKLKAGKVVVFSKTYCPYCKKAKDVLNKYNLPKDVYEVIELDEIPDGEEIQAYMKKKTGASSVIRNLTTILIYLIVLSSVIRNLTIILSKI